MYCSIGNHKLQGCIMNAAGVNCTTSKELIELKQDNFCSAVVTKTCTPEYRKGNPFPRYYEKELSSINSTGLANNGDDFYITHVKDNSQYKLHILSIGTICMEDCMSTIYKLNMDEMQNCLLEINMSCPNLYKSQLGYNFDSCEEYIRKITEYIGPRKAGMKLTPYFDTEQFINMSNIIKEYNPSHVTCINSVGNCLYIDIDSETTCIKPKKGLGGLGGKVILPIALANVWSFNGLINIPIIGCGGIINGSEVFEHILCGATAVQIGTVLHSEGITCFERLNSELSDIMKKKNYSSLDDFRGNLKTL